MKTVCNIKNMAWPGGGCIPLVMLPCHRFIGSYDDTFTPSRERCSVHAWSLITPIRLNRMSPVQQIIVVPSVMMLRRGFSLSFSRRLPVIWLGYSESESHISSFFGIVHWPHRVSDLIFFTVSSLYICMQCSAFSPSDHHPPFHHHRLSSHQLSPFLLISFYITIRSLTHFSIHVACNAITLAYPLPARVHQCTRPTEASDPVSIFDKLDMLTLTTHFIAYLRHIKLAMEQICC